MLSEQQKQRFLQLRESLRETRSKLTEKELELLLADHKINHSISPDDGKYWKTSAELAEYLTHGAELKACAQVQLALLETRQEFQPDLVSEESIEELRGALDNFEPYIALAIEELVTRHDQLAVIETLGLDVSHETKALLHGGTTSYDILDTARSYLLKRVWSKKVKPVVSRSARLLTDLAERSADRIQVGRTHLQHTSPVLFGGILANYARRIAEEIGEIDQLADNLPGKISGMVGTGASIEQISGWGNSQEYERKVLEKLGLKPDLTANQVINKLPLFHFGGGIVGLASVAADFAGDMRLLYSSEIREVTSRDNAERLGGSSADASKNNPINYENIEGKFVQIISGLPVLGELLRTDLQRDLRSSVQARYQPQPIIAETYEVYTRLNRAIPKLSINDDMMDMHLDAVRKFPSEAMTAILRAKGYTHPGYGDGHNFVKEMSKKARAKGKPLLQTALQDISFNLFYNSEELRDTEKAILSGELENYLGHARERLDQNIRYVKGVVNR